MKLTKDERELIIKLRESQEAGKAKFEAFLKKDLYDYDNDSFDLEPDGLDGHGLTTMEVFNARIKQLKESLVCKLAKGTRFVCYIDEGRECWYDDTNYGLEDMSEEWANEWLKNKKAIR